MQPLFSRHSLSALFISALILPFTTSLLPADNNVPATHTATIHYQPLESPTPLPLAILTYKPSHPHTYTVQSFTPPSISPSSSSSSYSFSVDDLIRIGTLNSTSNNLSSRTTLTALSSFEPSLHGVFYAYLDPANGDVWSVSYRASSAQPLASIEASSPGDGAAGDGKKRLPDLRILERAPAPRPVLNRPVVLSPDGKMEGEVVEKTFLQK